MKWNSITSLFIIAVTVSSCQNDEKATPAEEQEKSRLEKAEWLIGRWENNSEQGKMSETWVKGDDDMYRAETYFVIGSDTVFREHSELKETDETLECAITIPDQNNGKPIVFKLTEQEDHKLVFENPKHDFPQVITYMHKGDSVIAEISGKQKGKFAKERFAMVKVK